MKLLYSPEALTDFQMIKAYVTARFGAEKGLEAVRDLKQSIRKLLTYPNMGHSLNDIIDISTDYYYFFINPNYVIYSIDLDEIHIVRILNEKQDFLQNLFGITSKTDEGEDYWGDYDK